MSSSLVRKALDLFDESPSSKRNQDQTTHLGNNSRKQKSRQKRKQQLKDISIKNQSVKSAIEDFKRKRKTDQTEQNIHFLQRLSESKTQAPVVKKIMDRLYKPESEEMQEEKSTSAFTEEDFAWFEKHYKVTPSKSK